MLGGYCVIIVIAHDLLGIASSLQRDSTDVRAPNVMSTYNVKQLRLDSYRNSSIEPPPSPPQHQT